MSVYAPNSDVRLLSAPLTYGDGNQLDFASAAAQLQYFNSLPGMNFDDFTYQRKDMYIRIPALADTLYHYNYCTYTNFDGKRIYAFITRIEFVNQNCSHVHIKTDVFQTWMFDFDFKQCLVVREHTVTDLPYEHTLPESIATAAPIEVWRQRATAFSLQGDTQPDFDTNYRVVFVLSEKISTIPDFNPVMLGGVAAVAYYYAISREHIRDFTDIITNDAKADAVLGVYAVPIGGVSFVLLQSSPFDVWAIHDANETAVSFTPEKGFVIEHTAITFKNRKCLCYPYHFFRLWASNGQKVDLEIEHFTSIHPVTQAETCTIRTTCNPSQDTSLMTYPLNYRFNGQPSAQSYAQYGINLDAAITYNDFPEIAFKTDVFANYMALNKSSVRAQMFNTAVDTIFGLMQGTVRGVQAADTLSTGIEGADAGGIIGGIQQIESAGHQIYSTIGNAAATYAHYQDMQRVPDRVQGVKSSGVQLMCSAGGVYISEMCIKPEYMKIVDDYFTQYGYRVCTLKTPQFKSRENHNYIETKRCNIEPKTVNGVTRAIPQSDADELCAMFNSGLTVWHNPNTFGDYTQSNLPITP